MNPILISLIVFLVAAFFVAFYMDWLGLWVSMAEMQEQIDSAKKRKAKATREANTVPVSSEKECAVEHLGPVFDEVEVIAEPVNRGCGNAEHDTQHSQLL